MPLQFLAFDDSGLAFQLDTSTVETDNKCSFTPTGHRKNADLTRELKRISADARPFLVLNRGTLPEYLTFRGSQFVCLTAMSDRELQEFLSGLGLSTTRLAAMKWLPMRRIYVHTKKCAGRPVELVKSVQPIANPSCVAMINPVVAINAPPDGRAHLPLAQLVPLFDIDSLLRLCLLEHIRGKMPKGTVLEQLLFDESSDWLPFGILDDVGGVFAVRDIGSGDPKIEFTPAASTSEADSFLVASAVAHLQSTDAASSTRWRVVAPEENTRVRSRPTRLPHGLTALRERNRAVVAGGRANDIRGFLPGFPNDLVGELCKAICELALGDRPDGRVFSFANRGIYTEAGTGEVLRWSLFANDVISRSLPRSAITIQFPDCDWTVWRSHAEPDAIASMQEQVADFRSAWHLDLCKSVVNGRRSLFTAIAKLCQPTRCFVNEHKQVPLEFEFGWWDEWYRLLFPFTGEVHRTATQIRIVFAGCGVVVGNATVGSATFADVGFRLGLSRLGQPHSGEEPMPLGLPLLAYDQPQTVSFPEVL